MTIGDIRNIIEGKNKSINDTIIFNYDPTFDDIKLAHENDKIIIFNITVKHAYDSDEIMKTIPNEWKDNIILFFWPMEKEIFEEKLLGILNKSLGLIYE